MGTTHVLPAPPRTPPRHRPHRLRHRRIAQDESEQLETITVVGSRISYRDLLETRAVSLTKPGDYLLQPITLYNDTRNEAARKEELYATIRKLIDRAGDRYDIVHGENFVGELDAGNYRIELTKDPKRPDASLVSLSVRSEIGGDPKRGAQLIRDMRKFIDDAERVGRTEIETAGETALSMKKPERYRYDLVEAIAQDTNAIRTRMGGNCTVTLDGLNSRIEWERVSAAELLLYIPYTMSVGECRAPS